MKVEVFDGDVRNANGLKQSLSEWLEEMGTVSIEHTQVIGPDVETCRYQLVVFYRDQEEPVYVPPGAEICRQCKKRPAIKGQKQCESCKTYQKNYREKRRKEKKNIYP